MLQNADYKLLKNNGSFYCLQLCSGQLVSCSTNLYCIMIGTASCLVTCMVCLVCVGQWRTEGGGLGCSNTPPEISKISVESSTSHEQEEPASRFPFVVHCFLIRL